MFSFKVGVIKTENGPLVLTEEGMEVAKSYGLEVLLPASNFDGRIGIDLHSDVRKDITESTTTTTIVFVEYPNYAKGVIYLTTPEHIEHNKKEYAEGRKDHLTEIKVITNLADWSDAAIDMFAAYLGVKRPVKESEAATA